MYVPEYTTSPEKSILDVLKEVNNHNISTLPVIDQDGILQGIITKSSLVTTLSQQFDFSIDDE